MLRSLRIAILRRTSSRSAPGARAAGAYAHLASSGAARVASSAPAAAAAAAAIAAAVAASVAAAEPGSAPEAYELDELDELRASPRRTIQGIVSHSGVAEPFNGAGDYRATMHPKLLWRLARAKYDAAMEASASDDKRQQLEDAVADARAAAERDPRDGDAQRWLGICLSALGDHIPTKDAIANSFVIRDHWQRAVELNNHDASAMHLLGRWCLEVADLPWWKRSIAGALFATPPEASYEDAAVWFERAEAEKPGFWKANQVKLAQVALRRGDKALAARWLESALVVLPTDTEDDRESQALGVSLLAGLDRADRDRIEARLPSTA